MAKAEVTRQHRGPGKPTWRIELAGELAFSVKYRDIVQTRQHCLMSMANAGGGTDCTERLTPNQTAYTLYRAAVHEHGAYLRHEATLVRINL